MKTLYHSSEWFQITSEYLKLDKDGKAQKWAQYAWATVTHMEDLEGTPGCGWPNLGYGGHLEGATG